VNVLDAAEVEQPSHLLCWSADFETPAPYLPAAPKKEIGPKNADAQGQVALNVLTVSVQERPSHCAVARGTCAASVGDGRSAAIGEDRVGHADARNGNNGQFDSSFITRPRACRARFPSAILMRDRCTADYAAASLKCPHPTVATLARAWKSVGSPRLWRA